jgi:hypothetical protein
MLAFIRVSKMIPNGERTSALKPCRGIKLRHSFAVADLFIICLVTFKVSSLTRFAAYAQNGQSPQTNSNPAQKTLFNGHDKEIILRGRGTVRDADALHEGILFNINYMHTLRNKIAVSTHTQQHDLSGALAVEEQTFYDAQGHFSLYQMVQYQTGDRARVEIRDQKVLMEYIRDGKTKSSTETYTKETNAPGALMAYMSGFLSQLQKGEKVPVRLAVAERGSVLAFNIQGLTQDCPLPHEGLCIHLSLNNFVLKKLIKPIYMSFQKSPEGYRPLSIQTPAIVHKRKGSAFQKFTARIDYEKTREDRGDAIHLNKGKDDAHGISTK